MKKAVYSVVMACAAMLAFSCRSRAFAAGSVLVPGAELTLKQAIRISLHNHPRHKEAFAESLAAGERVGEARSFLLPQLYGASEYLRSTDNGIGNTSYYDPGFFPRMTGRNHNLPGEDFSQSTSSSNNYLGGLAASQFLFDFGRRHGFVTQRRFEAAAVAEQAQMTDLDLMFEVSQRYFGLLAAQQLVRVYEKAVEQRQAHLHEAKVRSAAGLRPALDIYVTDAELERAELHLVDARNAQADAKVALDNALGLTDVAPNYGLADVLTYQPATAKLADLLSSAFAQRPDLKVIEDQARAMGAEIKEYRSDYLPTANIQTGYVAMGTGLPAANNFNIGLIITWPIFNGFLTTDQIAEAKYRQQALGHAVDDLRQRVVLQVKTAFLDWQAAVDKIDRAQKALIASRVELELAEKRYQTGLTNIVELEDAQRHYTFDDAEYANSLYEYSVAKAKVDYATAAYLPPL